MPDTSLKTKITLAVSLLVVGLMCITALFTRHYFRTHFKETIARQQFALITLVAAEIDERIVGARNAVVDLSAKVTPEMVRNPEAARSLLNGERNSLRTFDNGIFLFDRNGFMVAGAPPAADRRGKDFSYREYFRVTVATRRPHVSKPYFSSQEHHHPAVMFTAPILTPAGEVAGVLGGSVDLTRQGILGRISEFKIGNTGYLFLYDTDRTMIAHPDRSRVLKRDVPPGANRLFDRAIEGFEGTGENVNSRGLRSLSSFKRLATVDWIVGANFPVKEAYAAVDQAERYIAAGLIPVIVIVLLVIQFIMKRFIAPLDQLTRQVAEVSATGSTVLEIPDAWRGEVGALARAFASLLDEVERQRRELQKREEIYRTVADFSRDIAIWYNSDRSELLYISPSCERITGFPDSDFYRDPSLLDRLFAPEDRIRWEEHVEMVNRGGECEPLEIRIQTRDGTSRWLNHYCRPVYGDGGEYLGRRSGFEDIDERKRAEESLRRHNEYLAALNETAIGLVSRLDVSTLLQLIISRAAALLHTSHGYIYLTNPDGTEIVRQVSLGCFAELPEQTITPDVGLVGTVWAKGSTVAVNDYRSWPGRLPDHSRDCLRAVVGVPLKSEEKVVGVLGLAYLEEAGTFGPDEVALLDRFGELASIALDNARLYTAAVQELRERERVEASWRKLFHAVEQSPVMVIITDTDGVIEYVNPKLCSTTGYTVEECIGANPRILKSGETATATYADLWDAISAGREWRGELHNLKKDGESFWVMSAISPIRDPFGTITDYIAVMEDITERKALENQLFQSQKMDAVGRLAGGIAHDFNNILSAIIGYASFLQMKSTGEPQVGTVLEQIVAAAERGAMLTRGLLSFGRQQPTNLQVANLNDVVRRMENLLIRLIGEDVELKTVLAPGSVTVLGDIIQVEQVIMNLATNARDAMPGGGTLTIATGIVNLGSRFSLNHGFGEPGQYALLTLSDTGTGIDDETLKRIFEPFFTTKETGKGTGLGLSIVYGIVKRHNGYINCYSEAGKGTVFSIYLPVTDAESIHPPQESVATDLPGGTEMILLAEDDAAVRKITRAILEEKGYRVIEAASGDEAIARFRKHWEEVRLLLLDLVMPSGSGREVHAEISRMRPDIKVIFTSGYTSEIIQEKGLVREGCICLPKPISQQNLLITVREVLDR